MTTTLRLLASIGSGLLTAYVALERLAPWVAGLVVPGTPDGLLETMVVALVAFTVGTLLAAPLAVALGVAVAVLVWSGSRALVA